jgi:hypothetical protein
MRRRRPLLLVAFAVAGLGVLGSAAGEAATIGRVTVGGDGQAVVVEITASEPLGYVLTESTEPFALSVLFAEAGFGFPDTRRELTGEGLATIETRTLSREGRTLARLDLRFTRVAPYSITRDGGQVRIRAEVAAPAVPIMIGDPGAVPAPPRPPARTEPAPAPASPEPAATPAPPAGTGAALTPAPEAAELRAVRPQSEARRAQVTLELTGSPTVRTSVRTRPDRLVIDIESARFAEQERTLRVGGGLLQTVRISQHTKTAVRIVCDLARPAPFRVEPVAGGLRVRLGEGVR